MKVIQLTIDEPLLRRVDSDPETKEEGRSAVVRKALAEYLKRKEAQNIRDAYRRGYGKKAPTDDEVGPWPEAQAWPEK